MGGPGTWSRGWSIIPCSRLITKFFLSISGGPTGRRRRSSAPSGSPSLSLNSIFVTSSEQELFYTKWLTRVLPYCFKALEQDFVEFLGKKLSLKHIEHGLCEYEKYF